MDEQRQYDQTTIRKNRDLCPVSVDEGGYL